MTGAAEEVLARLDLVAVEAGRRSAEIETLRSLPRDLSEALIDTGIFRLMVPTSLGGAGADLAALVRAVQRLAYHDGSTGWVVMSAALATADAAMLPQHHAATVLGDPRTVVVGHRGPADGVGRRTDDGGLIVTGRWRWSAGVANSTWVGADVTVAPEAEVGAAMDDGAGSMVHCLFRRDQVVALDTWHAIGLRGTGSTDFQVTEVFVPEGRWIGPTDRAIDRSAGAAAVAVGLASRAIDELGAQSEAAVLRTPVSAASSLLDRAIGEIVTSRANPTPDPGPEHELRSAAAHAIDVAAATVQRCYRLGGPEVVLHANPLQRLLRDIAVVTQHAGLEPGRAD